MKEFETQEGELSTTYKNLLKKGVGRDFTELGNSSAPLEEGTLSRQSLSFAGK